MLHDMCYMSGRPTSADAVLDAGSVAAGVAGQQAHRLQMSRRTAGAYAAGATAA